MARKRKRRKDADPTYWRPDRDGWYMNLRPYGGGQKACIAPGERYATRDHDVALDIALAAKAKLKAGQADDPLLEDYARRHLKKKADYRRVSTVERDERSLRHLSKFFGNVPLSQITPTGVSDYVHMRVKQVSAQTLLHEIHAGSNLFRRAVKERAAKENPFTGLMDKPEIQRPEPEFLENDEAARFLAASRAADMKPHPRALKFFHPLSATYLYSGGRKIEVLGMEVRDIDFEHGEVRFRHNDWRLLKRNWHLRTVPLWPDLREILERYLSIWQPSGLLFPAPGGGMLGGDFRGSIGAALKRAEIDKHVTLHTFRHTYTAARLQTTENGMPVSPYTVMRELGHKGLGLIVDTYGHLMKRPHRGEYIEYRETPVTDISEAHGA